MEPKDPEQSPEIQYAQARVTVAALEDALTATAALMVKRPSPQDQSRIIISGILPAQQSALALLQRHVEHLERTRQTTGPLHPAASSPALLGLRHENEQLARERDHLRARLDSTQQLLASVTTERDMLALQHQAAGHFSQFCPSVTPQPRTSSTQAPESLSTTSLSFSHAVRPALSPAPLNASTATPSPSVFNMSAVPQSPITRKRSASASSQRPVECVDVPSSPESAPVAKRPRMLEPTTAEEQITETPTFNYPTSIAKLLGGMADVIIPPAVESGHLSSSSGDSPSPTSRNVHPNQHQQPESDPSSGLRAAVPPPMTPPSPGYRQPLDEPYPNDDSGDDIIDVTNLLCTPPLQQAAGAASPRLPRPTAAPTPIGVRLAIPLSMVNQNVRSRYLDGVLQVQQSYIRVLAHRLISPPAIDPPIDSYATSPTAPPDDDQHDNDDADSLSTTTSVLHPTNARHLLVIQQQYGSQVTATLLETVLAQGIGVPVLHRWLQQHIVSEVPTRSTSQILRAIHSAWVRPVLVVKELERRDYEQMWRELAEEYLATAQAGAAAAARDAAERPVQLLLPASARLVVLLGLECCGLEAPTADARVPALCERRYALRERVALVHNLA